MNTNKKNRAGSSKNSSELKNRTEQLSETQTPESAPEKTETVTQNAPVKPYVNFAERDFNRSLPVEKVLEKLKRWMPAQYELAEVVGKWIWITFPRGTRRTHTRRTFAAWLPLEQRPQMLATPVRGDPSAWHTGTPWQI